MAINVLFVCQHGAAKSVIAARYLTELALSRGLTIESVAAGVEPDESVPPHVIEGLRADGLEIRETRPRAVTPELLDSAEIVVSFACDLSGLNGDSDRIVQWTGVPAVSDGYDEARTEIVRRVHAILDDLDERSTKERLG